jgi:hypothetical protein
MIEVLSFLESKKESLLESISLSVANTLEELEVRLVNMRNRAISFLDLIAQDTWAR